MRRCAGSVFAVQVQLRKYVLDHADSTASTRHEVDCTDPKCIPGMSCLADLDRELGIDHTDHTDRTDHLPDA